MNIFNTLFPKPVSISKIKDRRKKQIHSIIKRFSYDNIRLQCGKYFTKDDANKLKEKVLKYNF